MARYIILLRIVGSLKQKKGERPKDWIGSTVQLHLSIVFFLFSKQPQCINQNYKGKFNLEIVECH